MGICQIIGQGRERWKLNWKQNNLPKVSMLQPMFALKFIRYQNWCRDRTNQPFLVPWGSSVACSINARFFWVAASIIQCDSLTAWLTCTKTKGYENKMLKHWNAKRKSSAQKLLSISVSDRTLSVLQLEIHVSSEQP